MAKGFALVKGSEILQVLVGVDLKDARAKQDRLNRFNPLKRVDVYGCTFEYLGLGGVANVKLGKVK
jgi:hypothetical protein